MAIATKVAAPTQLLKASQINTQLKEMHFNTSTHSTYKKELDTESTPIENLRDFMRLLEQPHSQDVMTCPTYEDLRWKTLGKPTLYTDTLHVALTKSEADLHATVISVIQELEDENWGLKEKGAAFKKKEDTHRMAEANKAFAHYRW